MAAVSATISRMRRLRAGFIACVSVCRTVRGTVPQLRADGSAGRRNAGSVCLSAEPLMHVNHTSDAKPSGWSCVLKGETTMRVRTNRQSDTRHRGGPTRRGSILRREAPVTEVTEAEPEPAAGGEDDLFN